MLERKNINKESNVGEVRAIALEAMAQLRAEFDFDMSSKLSADGENVGSGLNCLTSSIVYSDRLQAQGIRSNLVYLPKRHFSSGMAFHFGVVVQEGDQVFVADPTPLKRGYGYGRIGTPICQDKWIKRDSSWTIGNFSGMDLDTVLYPHFVTIDRSSLNKLNNLMSDVLLAIREKVEYQKGIASMEQMLDLPLTEDLTPIKAEIYHTAGKLMHSGGYFDEALQYYISAHKVGTQTERPLKRALELQNDDRNRVWLESELRSILSLKSEEVEKVIPTWLSKAEDANRPSQDREYYQSLVEFYRMKLEGYRRFLC